MAEALAPFIVRGTMHNLTFYVMEGRNFVRKKSSLTRRKVLYAPCFKNTRHYAALMGRASKIGSSIYSQLPVYWRQGWMYRSFTGEAYTMLKARKSDEEIQEVLWQLYVSPVVNKQPEEAWINALNAAPKRSYRKLNSDYWKNKTLKSNRRKARKQQVLYYAGLMAQASKIGSKLYGRLPRKYARRSDYQFLTGCALKLLKQEISEEDILAELLPTLPSTGRLPAPKKKVVNVINHPKGRYYFIPSPPMRFSIPVRVLPEEIRLIFVSSG
jgi:hypothetical protein